MEIQKIINSGTHNRMLGLLETNGQLDIYRNSDCYPEIEKESLLNTTIAIPEVAPVLDVTGSPRSTNDADNAIKIYGYLGALSRTQACDSRLWATLTHTTFWSYCRSRWSINVDSSSKHVMDHWFEGKGRGLGALRRNAISRLWWAANLTVAPWEKDAALMGFKKIDRFAYTRIILSQQQNFQDVMERSYGSNLRLRICLLDALGKYQPELRNKDLLPKNATKKINLLLKHRQVDAMDIAELNKIIHGIVKKTFEDLTGEETEVA